MARFTFPWSRRERFSSQYSISDPAFAAWLGATDTPEVVNPYTILGLSAVLRSVSVISTTIAGLPLRTYERQGDERVRIPGVFDDPFPGDDGMTPFAWVETLLMHLLLWRKAFLWHEDVDGDGFVTSYRPLHPDTVTTKLVDGKKRFVYTENGEEKEVGTEQITHIPGPSINGFEGHPLVWAARNIFSGAISGDKAAATTLGLGIRLAGIVTPREGEEIDSAEGEEILKSLRASLLGADHAGDIAFINRKLQLDKWSPTNIESQWMEARTFWLGEAGRLFGVPPHLLNDTEKQTSWGTGVAEQNLGLARFTLMGWSSRMEQVFTRRLARGQFVEFDYKGLLQGTPAEEIELLLKQVEGGILLPDEARKILNLPPLTPKQKAEIAPKPTAVPPTPIRQEATA